jgi:uncharacterized membrane protein YbaN (DUF454 family)
MAEPSPQSETQTETRGALRPLYFVAGCVLLVVGIVGYFVPLMPGTIFLILAAACFARSSRRLETWLVNHPKLGPSVVAWRKNGAIPRKAKIVAISAMAISFAIVVLAHAPSVAIWITGAVMAASALFVGTRPGVPRTEQS